MAKTSAISCPACSYRADEIRDRDISGELSAPASRGQNQPIAAVSAAGTPPNRDQVAFGDEAVDVDRDVRVRVAVCGMEMFELRGPVQIGA
jgi:hypothetical protein